MKGLTHLDPDIQAQTTPRKSRENGFTWCHVGGEVKYENLVSKDTLSLKCVILAVFFYATYVVTRKARAGFKP